MLKSVLKEVEPNENKENSPGPLDRRKIHGDDYQKTLALSLGNHDNDDLHMEMWDDFGEDDSSYLSYTSSMWDAIHADDVETFRAFQEESVLNRVNKCIGVSGWTPSQIKSVE